MWYLPLYWCIIWQFIKFELLLYKNRLKQWKTSLNLLKNTQPTAVSATKTIQASIYLICADTSTSFAKHVSCRDSTVHSKDPTSIRATKMTSPFAPSADSNSLISWTMSTSKTALKPMIGNDLPPRLHNWSANEKDLTNLHQVEQRRLFY